jgi:hypothetical protein
MAEVDNGFGKTNADNEVLKGVNGSDFLFHKTGQSVTQTKPRTPNSKGWFHFGPLALKAIEGSLLR